MYMGVELSTGSQAQDSVYYREKEKENMKLEGKCVGGGNWREVLGGREWGGKIKMHCIYL